MQLWVEKKVEESNRLVGVRIKFETSMAHGDMAYGAWQEMVHGAYYLGISDINPA